MDFDETKRRQSIHTNLHYALCRNTVVSSVLHSTAEAVFTSQIFFLNPELFPER